jgi:hypothetical protein
MTSDALRSLFSGPFYFKGRPEPIAGDLRMSWGLSILILILLHSRGRKGNIQKLQFLGHAVRLPESREDVRAFMRGDLRSTDVTVRVEPWLNRAIVYAHAAKLVSVDHWKIVSLTEEGIRVAQELSKATDLFFEEKKFLREVAPKLTEQLLKRVWRMEDLL